MQVAKPVLHPNPLVRSPCGGFSIGLIYLILLVLLFGACVVATTSYSPQSSSRISKVGRSGSVADPLVERRPFMIVVAHQDRIKIAVIARERCAGVNADLLFNPFRHRTP